MDQTSVDIDWPAELLEIKPASCTNWCLRGVFPAFDVPARTTGKLATAGGHVFRYRHRRHLPAPASLAVSRIEPSGARKKPETIVLQASTIPEIGDEYLLYVWQPSDGGSPIALAYGVSATAPHRRPDPGGLAPQPSHCRRRRRRGPRYNAALERGSLILPEIDCADSSAFRHGLQPTWLDLAHLLQTDLPMADASARSRRNAELAPR